MTDLKRVFLILLCLPLAFAAGCKPAEPAEPAAQQEVAEPQEAAEPQEPVQAGPTAVPQSGCAMGFIGEDDGKMTTYMLMHGFLNTAGDLGYPVRVYRAKAGQAACEAVEQARQDGCRALMIANRGDNDEAVRAAVAAGLFVVVPYDLCTVEGVACNVVADQADYLEELARGLAERMSERSLKTGRILVYGYDTAACYAHFSKTIEEYYPQYVVVGFDRTATDDAQAVEELADFLLNNRDIKGLYAVDPELAPLTIAARSRAQARFRSEGAPKKTPDQTPVPAGQTPAPTPNPGLLTQILITVFGCGLSDGNLALFNDNDIYALCIEPYYEAAATGTMMLDRLLSGESVSASVSVNRPIVYAATIDKYLAIYQEVKALFGLDQA